MMKITTIVGQIQNHKIWKTYLKNRTFAKRLLTSILSTVSSDSFRLLQNKHVVFGMDVADVMGSSSYVLRK